VKGLRRAGIKRRSKRSKPTCVGPSGTYTSRSKILSRKETRWLTVVHRGHAHRHLGRPPDRRSLGPPWPLVFPVLLFASGFFRPSTYLEPCLSRRERPGNTKMSRLLGHGDVFQGDGDSLDPGLAGSGDCRRMGLADKLQFSALLWPSCAKSGILFLHGGQRETGIPEPHEPGHTRERLKEVRATHARAKKSGPLTPPCPKRSHWRAARPALADARATTPGGVPPKEGARGRLPLAGRNRPN
jgi:hypothetical protein